MTLNINVKVPRTRARTLVISLVLMGCSLGFALYGSNSAYSSDEVWSVKTVSLDYGSAMAALKADVHPPLYYQILFIWIRLFGTDERVVRLLSGLFYLFAILVLYLLAKRLLGNKTGLLVTVLYMTSPLAILSAQFARMYALLSLLSILSTALYIKPSTRSKSKLTVTAYILVNVLGTFTHIAFFFVLFGQIAFHLIFHRKNHLKTLLLGVIMSGVPYMLFWAPILLGQINQTQEGLAWVSKPSLSTLGELLVLYGGAFWLLVPVLVYIWWRTGLLKFKEFAQGRVFTLSISLLGITILTPLLISLVKPIFNARLAIVGLHLFALSIGSIIANRMHHFFVIELILVTAVGIVFLHPGFSNCDNRSSALYLNRVTHNGDAVIFTSLTRLPIDYYLERAESKKVLFETSFPAEIDKHPGYEGRITNPSRKATFEMEARALVETLGSKRTEGSIGKIFFFRGVHPQIDSLLEEELRHRFQLVPGEGLKCEVSPYFTEVSVYK